MGENATGRGPGESDPAERIRPGDPDALGVLYDEYAARLFAYVRSLGAAPPLAEDILQEVFMKLARRLSLGGKVRSPRAYLFTAVRNEFHRWGTRILRRSEIEASDAKGFLQAAAPGATAEEAAAVEEALAALPRAQREVVLMKVYGGLTFAEIAGAMGTSLNTAAARYRYAIEKLRTLLG